MKCIEYHLKKKEIIYIGDTIVDYRFSKKSKNQFYFADYGYGKLNLNNVKK